MRKNWFKSNQINLISRFCRIHKIKTMAMIVRIIIVNDWANFATMF